MSTITVYSKPNCVQCTATYRALDKAGLDYRVVDITENADAREYAMSLGHLQAPVVITDGHHSTSTGPVWAPVRRRSAAAAYTASRISGAELWTN